MNTRRNKMTNPEIDSCGTKYWYNSKKQYHREVGHAIEWLNGTKYWFKNGQFHREDGPAIEYGDGRKEWYINGKKIK